MTIDFIRLADLPWGDVAAVAASVDGSASDTPRAKVLRTDADGGVTAVVDLPAGGSLTGRPGQLVTFLVLGGAVHAGGRLHGHLGFGQVRPDGAVTFTTPAGARLLVFQQPDDGTAPLADPVDTLEAEWALAEDPSTQDAWREIVLTPVGHPAGAIVLRSLAVGDAAFPTHRHDWDEEVFVVDGERLTPSGPMEAGCYAFRPRGTWHGGYRTGSPGALLLVRRIGEAAALAGAAEAAPENVVPAPVWRPARLGPAAADVTALTRCRAILTGRAE